MYAKDKEVKNFRKISRKSQSTDNVMNSTNGIHKQDEY